MKFFLIIISGLLLTFCTNREQKLRQKEAELNKKEQELSEREKALQTQEQADKNDTTPTEIVNPSKNITTALNGLWSVTMTCSETDCEGSAVGDIKTERWDLSYQNKTLQAAARVNDKLTRIYYGAQKGNVYELRLKQSKDTEKTKAKMLVILKPLSDEKMEGRREIYREGCRIIYSLELEKL